jgi:uncharacterized alpha-E superfamily protein
MNRREQHNEAQDNTIRTYVELLDTQHPRDIKPILERLEREIERLRQIRNQFAERHNVAPRVQ